MMIIMQRRRALLPALDSAAEDTHTHMSARDVCMNENMHCISGSATQMDGRVSA